MRSNPAPIALFAYKRLMHMRATVDALRMNELAGETELFIFCDGSKGAVDAVEVEAVREYAHAIAGFKSVTVRLAPRNYGLANSIIGGVTWMLEGHDRVIVVEDDLVTSPYFLRFMNDGLHEYAGDERVASIHGYCYPIRDVLPETFFVRGTDCWGWATWRRAWDGFRADGISLLQEIRQRGLVRRFDMDGAYPYSLMLYGQTRGKNDSWAIRWHASAFLADRLTLFPGKSLVQNIGMDRSGTHSSKVNDFDTELATRPIRVGGIPVAHSEAGYRAFAEFFRGRGWRRVWRVMRRHLLHIKYRFT